MKKLFVALTLIATLCSAKIVQGADQYEILKVDAITTTASLTVAANQVAEIVTLHDNDSVVVGGVTTYLLSYTILGTVFYCSIGTGAGAFDEPVLKGEDIIYIKGPATIDLKYVDEPNFCIIRVRPNPNIMGIKQ